MEFLKERVYTALNADEVKIGSKVIAAYTIGVLKSGIGEGILQKVKSEFETARFVVDGASYPFVYLISEPEEKKLKWTDLKIGDVIRNKEANTVTKMVTGIDTAENHKHIEIGGYWLRDSDIYQWEKVDYELEEYERRVEE